MKRGVVYQRGTFLPDVRVSKIIAYLKSAAWSMRWVGMGMVILAGMGIAMTYAPLGMAEVKYQTQKNKVQNVEMIAKITPGPTQIVKEIQPDWKVPDENYSVYIEKIGAVSKVIPNVDIGDKKVYMKALAEGVAEASELAHPGEVGTTYLFAHNNTAFYMLDKVIVGDMIEVMYKKKLYRYEVTEKEILAASDTKYLVGQNTTEKLILQTCYPPGTVWKRLVLTGVRVMVY